jgi:hypothetical protein
MTFASRGLVAAPAAQPQRPTPLRDRIAGAEADAGAAAAAAVRQAPDAAEVLRALRPSS